MTNSLLGFDTALLDVIVAFHRKRKRKEEKTNEKKSKEMTDVGEEEEEIEETPDFDLMTADRVSSGRLKDIFTSLHNEAKAPRVLSVDAILPAGEHGFEVLRSILWLMKKRKSFETLSLRFNTKLTPEAEDYFIEWLEANDTLKQLYIMGTDLANDDKKSARVEKAWEKNLNNHRREPPEDTELPAHSFVRITEDGPPEDPDE